MTLAAACSRCGTAIPPGARFCMSCGSDVSGQQGQIPTVLAPAETPVTPEALLAALRQVTLGEFDVLAELGRGGMATVFLAHDLALNRKVAIKVMSPTLVLMGPDMIERFKREARTAAALSHPHIIPIHAVRQSGQLLFFVMKFVPGRTLDSIIRELGQLPIPMIQAIVSEVGGALAYAHRQGVVHRDVKPANIMVDDEGWAVMTDFGIAKASDARGLTMTGVTVGTPTYMSPEQCAAKQVTGASDQYSLGIVAYEMLTGAPPFRSDTMMGLMYSHFNDSPRPIHELRPDCPPGMAAAIARMLAKAPADRFPGLREAVAALGQQAAKPDEAVRTRLVKLAQTGEARRILGEVATPVSPIPKGRATPTVPVARVPAPAPTQPIPTPKPSDAVAGPSAAIHAKPAEAKVTRREPPAPPARALVTKRRWPVVAAAGAAGLIGLLLWSQGSQTITNQRGPEPKSRNTTSVGPNASPAANRPPTGPKKPQPSANLQTARAAQDAANRARDLAAAGGASQASLWPGDSVYGVGTTFLDESRFAAAVSAFEAARRLWSAPGAGENQRAPASRAVRSEVSELFVDWGDLIEAGQLDMLRTLWPSMTTQAERSWRRLFEDQSIEDLTASYEVLDVTNQGEAVEGRVREVLVIERESASRTVSRELRFRLRKVDDQWQIVSLGQ